MTCQDLFKFNKPLPNRFKSLKLFKTTQNFYNHVSDNFRFPQTRVRFFKTSSRFPKDLPRLD